MTTNLASDKFWVNKLTYHDAEKAYYERQAKGDVGGTKVNHNVFPKTTLAGEVAKARLHIKSSLECMDKNLYEMGGLTQSQTNILALFEKIKTVVESLSERLDALEKKVDARLPPVSGPTGKVQQAPPPKAQPQPKKGKDDDDDDDVDLFGSESEEEDEESKKVREQRLAEYAAKKSKKPALVAKSNIILDIKPWDDETDMKEMEKAVRAIEMDGLVWGASKLVPVAFKINKLQISCVVEDEKVSVDLLSETIEEIEDYVQSVDIAAFNKV